MRPPFGLFNFHFIEKFEHRVNMLIAGAGAGISSDIYVCPTGRIALFLDFHVQCDKVTSTAFKLMLGRIDAVKGKGALFSPEVLLSETLGTTELMLHWPMAKPSTNWTLGPTLVFLFPGEKITVSHALTAAETIVDEVGYTIIEYKDPRYTPDYECR